MGRILQAVFVLVLLAALGVLGYAYFGDMDADPAEVRSPVDLPGLAPPAAPVPAVPAAALAPVPATDPGMTSATEAQGGN
ncbi:hypothetical protein CKO11_08235 [Rhodobacter sp. TJ_12]|uniref:hypothetical protein n=1 Tax=Rhodobacter sp. TJ_12 TaxID=2029399 RepID=UPI001CC1A4D8|nr:hypothetical protein [Rhodobacter sp. TJ_12]MBZ4022444.1 hypothetical protein [Rhodobacter sp. TJ_12]